MIKDQVYMQIGLISTKVNKVEYKNIDFFQVLEDFGGLQGAFILITNLFMLPLQEYFYSEEKNQLIDVDIKLEDLYEVLRNY